VRVLVASDAIGALPSLRAGQIIASGWIREEVMVASLGEAGAGFVSAFAAEIGAPLEISAAGSATVTWSQRSGVAVLGVTPEPSAANPEERSSYALGEALARRLVEDRPSRVYLDLGGWTVADAGAGLLAAVGTTADRPLDRGGSRLTGVTDVDLGPARTTLGDTELVGVVPAGELGQHLFGLRGSTSLRARATGADEESMLRNDAALERFARLVAVEQATKPGAGACGGLGFAVLALGGRLTTGPAIILDATEHRAASSRVPDFLERGVELVVTGCSIFDFATRGGGVVSAVADTAATALSPCIAIAGEVVIGAREMRAMGIEAAYAVRETSGERPDSGPVGEEELGQVARRVARSWSW
jgi:glycerate 2-kinase